MGKGGQDEARRLAGADVVEGTHADHRDVVADEILIPQHILGHFADAVRVFRVQGMILTQRQLLRTGPAVLLTGADDEEARFEIQCYAALQQIDLSQDVVLECLPGIFVGGGNGTCAAGE
jgi:hypothetical protein